MARALAAGQGVYWAATGAWPLLHMRSFEAVTGGKLVQTVGLEATILLGCLVVGRPRCGRGEGER